MDWIKWIATFVPRHVWNLHQIKKLLDVEAKIQAEAPKAVWNQGFGRLPSAAECSLQADRVRIQNELIDLGLAEGKKHPIRGVADLAPGNVDVPMVQFTERAQPYLKLLKGLGRVKRSWNPLNGPAGG